jgi:hypothetical protein
MSATTAPANIATLKQATPNEANLPAVRTGFFDLQSFELMQRIAKGFSASTLVPKEYQNNIANCMIALNLAQRINGDPLMVMQNLVIVHGRPTWSAQYLIATANMCGRFTAIRFEFFGERGTDDWGCRAWAMEKGANGAAEKLVGAEITIAIAKKEGWFGKNGSKWQSIPQQMLMYRAGSWWVRAYAPELSMGLMTADEAHDVFEAVPGNDGVYSVDISTLREPSAREFVDTSTGEIIEQQPVEQGKAPEADAKPSHQEQRGTPTLADALSFAQAGDYDMAREIARALGPEWSTQVEKVIQQHQGGQQQEQQQSTTRRNRGQGIE